MVQDTPTLLARADQAIAEAKRLTQINFALYEVVRANMYAFWQQPHFEGAQYETQYPQNLAPGK